ncbi:hypothetical protein [Simiduia agarivorans]|uniref:Uncharacterized protein n=1 Tax=Simiduia agarivorans (strain DSM 21679 / JCM 13881 / BCRC 17597 / SA1) TaxID=1117647 RepID=K4KYF4_SIMAS|nr:hypothetical protein [Simiduia agarivorans]AFU98977.1 hypothetical protein M5M_08950 [Simiduia agarivorans SA1 = DSM 21679]
MKKLSAGIIAAVLSLASTQSPATSKAIIIGGGNTLENSQGQIEENVQWVSDILDAKKIETQVYFTHGSAQGVDIVYFGDARLNDTPENVLRRIYLDGLDFAKSYKRNTLPKIDGPTTKASLTEALSKTFKSLENQAESLLIFNGHGDIDFSNTDNNALKLWQDERLSINEIRSLFESAPQQSTVRFIFTQCFSGSFSKLAFDNLETDQLATPRSCGFMAESDRREAEGCDLGINPSEFRDYTTYFFAALNGYTRTGQPINLTKTDLDKSGEIDFREAHLYTLANAHSSDLSRSTSEQFVEYKEPWYRRWDTAFTPKNNVYSRIAIEVAEREKVASGGLPLLRDILHERAALKNLTSEQDTARAKIEQIQATLRTELGELRLAELTTDKQEEVYNQAIQMAAYQQLKHAQDELMQLNEQVLQQTRNLTQRLKAARMNRISRLAHYQKENPAYQSLVDCESSGQL